MSSNDSPKALRLKQTLSRVKNQKGFAVVVVVGGGVVLGRRIVVARRCASGATLAFLSRRAASSLIRRRVALPLVGEGLSFSQTRPTAADEAATDANQTYRISFTNQVRDRVAARVALRCASRRAARASREFGCAH